MSFTKLVLPVAIASCFAITSVPSYALEAGDWLIHGRIINIMPNDSSENLHIAGQEQADNKVEVDSAFTLDVSIAYMITPNIGVELLLDPSTEHEISGDGALSGLGEIATTRVLPPALLLQYHFMPNEKIKPYVGAGLNYTLFFSEDTSKSLNDALSGVSDFSLDSSFGFALQAGIDIDMGNELYFNADVKYIDISTTAEFNAFTNADDDLPTQKATIDVDVDPWVFGIGIGKRF